MKQQNALAIFAVSALMTLCSLPALAQSNATPTPDISCGYTPNSCYNSAGESVTVTPTPKQTPIEVVDPATPTPTASIDVAPVPASPILFCDVEMVTEARYQISCTAGSYPASHTVEATVYMVSGAQKKLSVTVGSGATAKLGFNGEFSLIKITDNTEPMFSFLPSDVARIGDGATLEVYLPLIAR